MRKISVSVIIPTKDEVGTIKDVIEHIPRLGSRVELVFVDGHSTDGTWEALCQLVKKKEASWLTLRAYMQPGKGKWDAVSYGLHKATGDILMIYDADMSVPIDDLRKFYTAVSTRPNVLVIGSRFVYPQERGAMQLLNHTGNIVFSWIFSRMLHATITDTLCGTKVFTKTLFRDIWNTTSSFRVHDPYGDFTLLLGAAKLKTEIVEVPVKYRARVYGETKISRFRDGLKLLIVLWHAIRDFWPNSLIGAMKCNSVYI